MSQAGGRPAVARTASLASPLKLFLWAQTLLALGCFATEAFCRFALHLGGAFVYPLKTANQTAWDFTLFEEQFRHFHHPEFFAVREFPYPAPVAVAYAAFFSYHAHPLRLFLGFILAAFLAAAILFGRALRRRGVSTTNVAIFLGASLLLSYPLWFELKQGNMEICVWVLLCTGVWAFCRGRGYTAAACFGVAGSMKIFPLIYLGLLLAKRRYLETAFSAGTVAVSTVVSLWLVGPDIFQTWRKIEDGVAFFRIQYMLRFREDEIGFDHSLFGIYKRFTHHLPEPAQLGHISDVYVGTAAACGIAIYFLRIRYLPILNQALCLTVASILLPPISFDYTLMSLYVPWAMLVLFVQDFARDRSRGVGTASRTVPGVNAAFLCLAILMAPESEFIRHGIHFGGQVKALVLAALLWIALKYPFARTREGVSL